MKLVEDKNPISDYVWQFLTIVFANHSTPELCTTLIAIIANYKDINILKLFLNLLSLLIKGSGGSINQVLQIFDYYVPFSFLMSQSDDSLLQKVLQIVHWIEAPQTIKLEEFSLLSVIVLNIENSVKSLANKIFNIMILTSNKSFEVPDMFPIFVFCV